MEFSKKIRKSGLFYYRQRKLQVKWELENQLNQTRLESFAIPPSSSCLNVAINPLCESVDQCIESDSDSYCSSGINDTISFNGDYDLDLFSNWNISKPSSSVTDEMDLGECIRYWALKTNQSHESINLIMDIIRTKTDGKLLPRSARTLLKTNRIATTDIVNIPGGQYWYNGVRKCLQDYFRDIKSPLCLSINVNIDGIPVSKSSKSQMWPILFNISEMADFVAPMPIAIFYGKSKPGSVEDFLRPFVDELINVIANGVTINGHNVEVRLRCFICDSPARAFIKGVACFNSKNGCLKCVCEGEFSHESRTVIFKSLNSEKRTDREFRKFSYDRHHKTATPLLDIPNLNIIEDVIVADRLHLIDLGVVKRLLIGWRDGTLGYNRKLSSHQINQISSMLVNIKLPSEVHRKFRGLDNLLFWKGSEFSSFLHYASIVVLKDIVTPQVYNHYLLLFCSITMLSSDVYKNNWHVARKMLETFISDFMSIYGERYATSNVHNLQHIVDETEKFGSLSSISAYPFENALQKIKHLLRSGSRSLEQVVNRLSEIQSNEYYTNPQATKQQSYPVLEKCGQNFKIYPRRSFFLSNTDRDGWFLTNDKQIVRFIDVDKSKNPISIRGLTIKNKWEFFNYPFKLSILNIFATTINNLDKSVSLYLYNQIKCKLVAIQTKHDYIFIPLVHIFEEQTGKK